MGGPGLGTAVRGPGELGRKQVGGQTLRDSILNKVCTERMDLWLPRGGGLGEGWAGSLGLADAD